MQINKKSVLIGSDFELFLVNNDGKTISAIPFNVGTKSSPEKLPREGCCLQYDNVTQEANVPPVKLGEFEEFWDNVQYIRNYIRSKYADEYDLKLVCCATKELDQDQLIHPEAKAGGCDVSYNAWLDGSINSKPLLEETNLRSCGLHFHFSFEGADVQTCIDLMKVFDTFVTVPCLFLDPDTERRKLYGKAGEMRLCDWNNSKGFEARTLSSYLLDDKEYVEFIFNQIDKMFDYYNEKGIGKIQEFSGDIMHAINEYDKEVAGKICDEFGILLLLKQEV